MAADPCGLPPMWRSLSDDHICGRWPVPVRRARRRARGITSAGRRDGWCCPAMLVRGLVCVRGDGRQRPTRRPVVVGADPEQRCLRREDFLVDRVVPRQRHCTNGGLCTPATRGSSPRTTSTNLPGGWRWRAGPEARPRSRGATSSTTPRSAPRPHDADRLGLGVHAVVVEQGQGPKPRLGLTWSVRLATSAALPP